jgi:hypothetical protein
MEVVQSRAALLSNFEVLQLLNERMESQKQRQKEYPNLEYAENLRTIQFEVKCLPSVHWRIILAAANRFHIRSRQLWTNLRVARKTNNKF